MWLISKLRQGLLDNTDLILNLGVDPVEVHPRTTAHAVVVQQPPAVVSYLLQGFSIF